MLNQGKKTKPKQKTNQKNTAIPPLNSSVVHLKTHPTFLVSILSTGGRTKLILKNCISFFQYVRWLNEGHIGFAFISPNLELSPGFCS